MFMGWRLLMTDLHAVEVLGVLHHQTIRQDQQVSSLTGSVRGDRGGRKANRSQNSDGTGRRDDGSEECRSGDSVKREGKMKRWGGRGRVVQSAKQKNNRKTSNREVRRSDQQPEHAEEEGQIKEE